MCLDRDEQCAQVRHKERQLDEPLGFPEKVVSKQKSDLQAISQMGQL